MWKKTWNWTKFFVLMLSVGIVVLPFTLDLPAPLVFALVSFALLAVSGMVVRHTRTVHRLIMAPVALTSCPPAASHTWPFSMPTDPGTTGSVRARAPATRNTARG